MRSEEFAFLVNTSPADLRAAASAQYAQREDSFDRCDTDGFLTQAASGAKAEQYRRQADINEHGGFDVFVGLYEAETGRRVIARGKSTRYGVSWLLDDEEAERFGRRWVPMDDSEVPDDVAQRDNRMVTRSRVQVKLGLIQRYELQKAVARIGGTTWHVYTERVGDWWGRDARLVADDELREWV